MRWIWNTGLLSSAMEFSRLEGRPGTRTAGRRAAALSPRAHDRGFHGAGRSGLQAPAKKGKKAPPPVERDRVVAAADVGRADEDLRHRAAPAGRLQHLRAL